MSSGARTKAEQDYITRMLHPLIYSGARLVGVAFDAEGEGFFGLIMESGGGGFKVERSVIWVQQDAEGNGGGWITVDPQQ